MLQKTTMLLISMFLVLTITACTPLRDPRLVDAREFARETDLPITISERKTSLSHMSGNVDVRISYTNTSNRTIQSVRFTLLAKDTQGNSVPDERTNRFNVTVESAGPVEPGGDVHGRWNAVWKNHRVACSEIREIIVRFADLEEAVSYTGVHKSPCR